MINAALKVEEYAREFSETGRVQILNFLAPSAVKELSSVMNSLDWSLVVNEGEKNFDINAEQAKILGTAKLSALKRDAKRRALTRFQYLFENYRVSDFIELGIDIPPLVRSIFDEMNQPDFLKSIAILTGQNADFIDMQATRYRAGHFLTDHDDDVAGKNRKLAYVMNLSQRWRPNWGGQLEFLTPDKDVSESYLPIFNSLSLFKVPSDHRVSPVKIAAKHPRLSLTGWFRTHT
jgi:Rps23 Pro-64 3,4-dihydroxylase Tpa1-like proline 4-hydroxylase